MLRRARVWQVHGYHSGRFRGWQGPGGAQEFPVLRRRGPDPAAAAPIVLEASPPASLETFGE